MGLVKSQITGNIRLGGNVWEWCWDGYSADFYTKKESGLILQESRNSRAGL